MKTFSSPNWALKNSTKQNYTKYCTFLPHPLGARIATAKKAASLTNRSYKVTATVLAGNVVSSTNTGTSDTRRRHNFGFRRCINKNLGG